MLIIARYATGKFNHITEILLNYPDSFVFYLLTQKHPEKLPKFSVPIGKILRPYWHWHYTFLISFCLKVVNVIPITIIK